ncbi:acyl-CoA N-acyltransferase [Podospora australis]|uniref:Acyl-CoA N-acyltransferase n=1 Tax=Podospora australis TaxID=1536484 RepID=A0AAN6WM98_9PEZI|nr:acyl-CoA N-acyltransferase [Podospora australis]
MPLILREAKLSDSARIGVIGATAFADTVSLVVFPPHMRHLAKNGDAATEEAEWRATRNERRMKNGNPTFVVVDVAQDGTEQDIVGFAQWGLPKSKNPNQKSSQEVDHESTDAPPPSLDKEGLDELYGKLDAEVQKVLGEQGADNMWYLMILAVDPKQKRRGIGKMLINHGLSLAAKDNRDVFLAATPEGKHLYNSVGFQQVGDPFDLGTVKHYSMLWKVDGSK